MPAVRKEAAGARMIPEPREWTRTSVTLPTEVWDQLDVHMRAVNSTRPGPERYSRDEFMAELLSWACRELAKESSEQKMRSAR